MLLRLSLLDLFILFILLLFSLRFLFSWLFLHNFLLSLLIRLLLWLLEVDDRGLSLRILALVDHVTSSEILLNKVQLDGLNDLHLLSRYALRVGISRFFVSIWSSFTTVVLWLLFGVLAWHWLLLWSLVVLVHHVHTLGHVPIGHHVALWEALHRLVLVHHVWSFHHVPMRLATEVLVVSNVNMVHLLLMSLKGTHLWLELVINDRWRSMRDLLFIINTPVLILHLLLEAIRHLVWVIVRKLRREHKANIAVSVEWFFVITDLVKGKLHLSRYYQIVTIFDSHFCQTF